MGILDGAQQHVDKLNKNLADKIGSDADKHIQKEIKEFYYGKLFDDGQSISSMVDNGEFEQIEPRIEKFMSYMQEEYESKLHNRVAASLDEKQLEKIEMEDVKETLILLILEQEIGSFVQDADRRIKEGYQEHLYMVPGDHIEYVEGEKFKAGNLGPNSLGQNQSRVVQKEWIENLLSSVESDLNQTQKVLAVLKHLNAPEEELEPARTMENLLEERVKIMGDVISHFESGETEKAKKEYEKLLEKVENEESRL